MSIKSKQPVRKSAKKVGRASKTGKALKVKTAPGNPFAGIEHVFGSVALPRDPRPSREIIRERILADHNT